MSKEHFTLGIDIGSSFFKAALFSTKQQEALFSYTLPAVKREPSENPRAYEIRADRILEQVVLCLEKAVTVHPPDALLLSTQMHGFVLCRKGFPDLYISWQDLRCLDRIPGEDVSYLERQKQTIPPELLACSGVPLKPSLGLCNLLPRLEETGSGQLFTLGSYLCTRLGGENICHITNAAPLGLVDVKKGGWNQPLLDFLGLGQLELPRIADGDFQPCGQGRIQGHSFSLYPDYGDQQVAVLGAMPHEKDLVINIATASQISQIQDHVSFGSYESRPFFEGRCLATISNMPGGRNFAVLTDFFRDCLKCLCQADLSTGEIWERLQASYAEEHRGLEADILFYPTETRSRGGSLSGISPDNLTVNGLLTAAYQSAGAHFLSASRRLPGGSDARGITFSGGVSWKNPALTQTISRCLHLDYRMPPIPDEAFNGLYRLSLALWGEISGLGDQIDRILTPAKKEDDHL